jgi:hypothetical protein
MRTLLRIKIDTETGNRAVERGDIHRAFMEPAEQINPEVAYFLPTDGQRSAMFVFDMQDGAARPPIVEPLFRTFDASVELSPVMNLDDLHKGLASVGLAPGTRRVTTGVPRRDRAASA